MSDSFPQQGRNNPPSEPVFNLPAVILALMVVFVAIHLMRVLGNDELNRWLLLNFAFSPARYVTPPELAGLQFPGGVAADVWTFFSHMFLHGDWLHLIINGAWMTVFGTIVARRLGALRFILFSFFTAAAGATANLVYYLGEYALLIGASGAISGQMAGAVRLIYSTPGGLAAMRFVDFNKVPLVSLPGLFQNRAAMVFIAVWLVLNVVFGVVDLGTGEDIGRIAWEAHFGGFLAGLLFFAPFDKGARSTGYLP